MQDDIMRFVKHFERVGGISTSFITLLPKVKDPLSLSDYRLIGLIGCVYKIIAKVLASRLKKVISYVIDEIQLAYTEERNIPDH